MLKSIKMLLRQEREKYRIPRSVQDLIPVERIWKDGIFLSGNKYSKVYRFTDINYQVASLDDKKQMFFDYSAILNGLDAGASTKITINNHRMNRGDFEESVLMPMRGDAQDVYRQEHNNMLLDKTVGSHGNYAGKVYHYFRCEEEHPGSKTVLFQDWSRTQYPICCTGISLHGTQYRRTTPHSPQLLSPR